MQLVNFLGKNEESELTPEEELEGYRLARMDAYDRMKANPKNRLLRQYFKQQIKNIETSWIKEIKNLEMGKAKIIIDFLEQENKAKQENRVNRKGE